MITGRALKVGDNIDTDIILPGKYMVLTDPSELAEHALEGLNSDFSKRVKDGAILVAGRNFGCGSSREQAPIALKYAGVRCVVARSYARIFYRNAVNIGLPVVECGSVWDNVEEGDKLVVSLMNATVENKSKGVVLQAVRLPAFILEIFSDGGLIENLRRKMRENETL